MTRWNEIVQIQNREGQPMQVGATRIVPHSQALTVRLPFGGFVYNRPTGVSVERNGETRLVPVVDVTRIVLISLGVATLFTAMAMASRMRR